MDQAVGVVAVRAAVEHGAVAVGIGVVVVCPVAVAVDSVVPDLGDAGMDGSAGVVAVVAVEAHAAMPVVVGVVVVGSIAVAVDAVVPDLDDAWMDQAVGVVAVEPAEENRAVAVDVGVEVVRQVAVAVDAVVPGVRSAPVDAVVPVVAVALEVEEAVAVQILYGLEPGRADEEPLVGVGPSVVADGRSVHHRAVQLHRGVDPGRDLVVGQGDPPGGGGRADHGELLVGGHQEDLQDRALPVHGHAQLQIEPGP